MQLKQFRNMKLKPNTLTAVVMESCTIWLITFPSEEHIASNFSVEELAKQEASMTLPASF
jgi:hypothetical protein